MPDEQRMEPIEQAPVSANAELFEICLRIKHDIDLANDAIRFHDAIDERLPFLLQGYGELAVKMMDILISSIVTHTFRCLEKWSSYPLYSLPSLASYLESHANLFIVTNSRELAEKLECQNMGDEELVRSLARLVSEDLDMIKNLDSFNRLNIFRNKLVAHAERYKEFIGFSLVDAKQLLRLSMELLDSVSYSILGKSFNQATEQNNAISQLAMLLDTIAPLPKHN